MNAIALKNPTVNILSLFVQNSLGALAGHHQQGNFFELPKYHTRTRILVTQLSQMSFRLRKIRNEGIEVTRLTCSQFVGFDEDRISNAILSEVVEGAAA